MNERGGKRAERAHQYKHTGCIKILQPARNALVIPIALLYWRFIPRAHSDNADNYTDESGPLSLSLFLLFLSLYRGPWLDLRSAGERQVCAKQTWRSGIAIRIFYVAQLFDKTLLSVFDEIERVGEIVIFWAFLGSRIFWKVSRRASRKSGSLATNYLTNVISTRSIKITRRRDGFKFGCRADTRPAPMLFVTANARVFVCYTFASDVILTGLILSERECVPWYRLPSRTKYSTGLQLSLKLSHESPEWNI